jgi:hypothetical protein
MEGGQLPFDPSVQALIPFPSVLQLMNQDLNWTAQLGTAVLAQRGDVMDAVQRMRKKAYDAGNLKTSEQIKVVQSSPQVIEIQPPSPQVIYVPTYSPQVVYAPAPAPAPEHGRRGCSGLDRICRRRGNYSRIFRRLVGVSRRLRMELSYCHRSQLGVGEDVGESNNVCTPLGRIQCGLLFAALRL